MQHPNQIAIKQGIGISMMFKYAYDTVFNPDDGNQQVGLAAHLDRDLVACVSSVLQADD